ncbi:MAG: TldD/PmbA family protein [Anaerolineae bacterium]|nr:TldD/PmbA family protein [Anaerolineae bacterium]
MISSETARKVLDEALRGGGDLAEIYVEDRVNLSFGLEEQRVEDATLGGDRGAGIRVFYGEMAAYAYTDDLSEESLVEAAKAVSAAGKSTNKATVQNLTRREHPIEHSFERPYDDMSEAEKAAMLRQVDGIARGCSPHVSQVITGFGHLRRRVWIFNSDGVWAEDDRNIIEFRVMVIAQKNGVIQRAYEAFGGQTGLELITQNSPEAAARKAAETAVKMLDAKDAPAGEMPVVIGNGWGGVLFHEACGHPLEADFITKGASAYTGMQGQRVGAEFLNAIDDGSLPGRRGTMRFDDEGTPTQRTVLIENGILKEFMWDLTEARRAGRQSTGNGRRQSFRHMPMPRMTNTFIDAGPHDPEEIVASVDKGIYVASMGGGQVEIARGDFVFNVTEGYMIEKGQITYPVKGATLIGNGPKVLSEIDMIGGDLALDPGFGMCGKGQSARVSVGQPTIRIPRMTVGGTDKPIQGQMGI